MILLQSTGMFTYHIHCSVWLKAVTQVFSHSYLVGWKEVVIWTAEHIHMCLQITFESIHRELLTHWVWNQVPSSCSRGKSLLSNRYCGSDSLGTLSQAFRAIKINSHAFS